VVSTDVGGIPEVLPPDLIYLAEPSVGSLLLAVEKAVADLERGRNLTALEANARVRSLYNWADVTRRTVVVYDRVAAFPAKTIAAQLRRYLPTGVLPWLLVVSLCHVILLFLDWYIPKNVSNNLLPDQYLHVSLSDLNRV